MKLKDKINVNNSCSIEELKFYYYIKQIFPSALYRHRFYFLENKRRFTEVDILIPEIAFAIEYDGYRYHNSEENIIKDKNKTEILKENCINLLRIREKTLPIFNIEKEFKYIRSKTSFKECFYKIINYIFNNYDINETTQELSHKLISNPINFDLSFINFVNRTHIEKSIVVSNPEILKEWDFEKNGFLKPENFTHGSSVEVWWVCKNGCSYLMPICNKTRKRKGREKKNGCPYCDGLKVCDLNSLATVNPKIASEWHPTKNGNLTPNDVRPHSDKKVYWLCSDNKHTYDATISNKSKGQICPYCTGHKVDESNSLTVLNSELASEWHPTKNNLLTSDNVTPKSEKIIWWECKNCKCSWQAKIIHRNNGHKKCPTCYPSKYTVSKFNSLKSLNKKLSSEWHPTKNGNLTPSMVTFNSWTKVVWQCKKCSNTWEARVYDRHHGNQKCKSCYPFNHNHRKITV